MVIELRQNNDADTESIADALARFDAAIAQHHPRNVVLDMRLNSGGDLNTTRNFVRSLPDRIPGRIFVLTSPWTFSAAISTTAYLKQAAPDRVTIVGDYVNGCEGFTDCHGNVVRNPIRVPNLDVQIAAPWTVEAYAAGRDPGIEAIAAALR
jgi:hypothetical protein